MRKNMALGLGGVGLMIITPVTATPNTTQTGTPNIFATHAYPAIIALKGDTTPEYVTVKNFGDEAQQMTGWTIFSVVGAMGMPAHDE